MRQRLVRAAHNAKANVHVAALHECGNNRMERTLARRQRIGRVRIEREKRATILQSKTKSLYHDPGTKSRIVALDQGNDVAIFIDRGKIRCVAGGRATRSRIAVRLCRIDQCSPLCAIFFCQQSFHRDLRESWVCVVAIQVSIRQFHGLDLFVQLDRSLRAILVWSKVAHDVEHLKCGHALAVGWKFVNFPSAIIGGDRFDPFRGIINQIVELHRAVESGRGQHDRFGDLTFVKSIAALLCNQVQSLGDIRIAELLAQGGRFAARQKHAARFLGLGQLGFVGNPVGLNNLRHRVAMLRVIDRGCEKVLPRQSSKTLVRLAPSFHHARHCDGLNTVLRHGGNSLLGQKFNGQLAWREPAGVESVKFAGLRVPIEQEEVAANSIHHGLGHAEHRVRRDSGVHRRATFGQHLRAGL